jgi:hypothetical protein
MWPGILKGLQASRRGLRCRVGDKNKDEITAHVMSLNPQEVLKEEALN